ncbi:hypothetical protein ES692_06000 [Psychroserpens burtonensis]|uniref:Uncharacterized protein n=1 Tax=Psychroserpens burtonensis TaxID=49278 RepID=A0A5C7BBN9_9FLAO|nr:hypothetical protein [Psychroserpens burtonensis]TXE18593.1 hypothetical protein ES692_06000 [Psychroserpens burtonensis]
MKNGKARSISICVSDIPKDRILKHENGKMYMNLSTWDSDDPDKFGNDFSVSMSPTKAEIEKRKSGEKVNRVFIGNGKIWEQKEMQATTEEDHDDLPF